MILIQAISVIKQGKKIRRPCFQPNSYLYLKDHILMSSVSNQRAYMTEQNLEATDWEIYEDIKVKCIYCKKPIHINRFGGITQKGLFCNNTLCLINLINDEGKKSMLKCTHNRNYRQQIHQKWCADCGELIETIAGGKK